MFGCSFSSSGPGMAKIHSGIAALNGADALVGIPEGDSRQDALKLRAMALALSKKGTLTKRARKFLRAAHSKETQEGYRAIDTRMGEVMEDRSKLLNTKEGEMLSFEDISDVYFQVMGEHRAKTNMSLTTRSKTGEISDYLEVRRPFGAAQ